MVLVADNKFLIFQIKKQKSEGREKNSRARTCAAKKSLDIKLLNEKTFRDRGSGFIVVQPRKF